MSAFPVTSTTSLDKLILRFLWLILTSETLEQKKTFVIGKEILENWDHFFVYEDPKKQEICTNIRWATLLPAGAKTISLATPQNRAQ